MPSPTYDPNHVAEALAALPEQYKGKARLAGLLSSFAAQIQALEDAAIGPQQSLGHKLDANTVALWRMDEATGGAALGDATGIYNAPVAAGTLAPIAGQISGARTFGT